MRILIMKCSNNDLWYHNKIGKTYEIKNKDKNGNIITKDGVIFKKDCSEI